MGPPGASMTPPSTIIRDRRSDAEAPRLELLGRHDLLARDEAALRGSAEQIVEVGIGAEVLRVAARIRAIHVHERDVEAWIAGNVADELFAVFVRRPDRSKLRLRPDHVRPQAGPGRQEWEAEGSRLQPPLEHPSSSSRTLDGSPLACGAEMRLERNGVERHRTR